LHRAYTVDKPFLLFRFSHLQYCDILRMHAVALQELMFCLTCQPRVNPSLPESAARTEDNSFAQPRPSSSRDFANARWVVRSLTLLRSWVLNAEEDERDDEGDAR
jgi:hypothetical protein